MAKIDLSNITSGYNLTKINENFQKVEDALNGEVLYRDNPDGEDNSLQSDLDANNKRILNLPDPISASEPIRKQEWDQTVGLAEQYRDEAESWATIAENSSRDGSAVRVDSIQDLGTIVVAEEGQQFLVTGYHSGTTVGGGLFVRKSSGRHNGGTFIDPFRTFPTDWTNQTQLAAWFENSGVDVAGFERLDTESIDLTDFGAHLDGVTDDTKAANALGANSNGKIITGDGNCLVSDDVVLNNVNLQFSGEFIGTGSVRGVLLNDDVPHTAFKVPYNTSLSKNRAEEETANLYLDPCLGDDTNSGTSGNPVATLSGLKTRLDTLIGLGADSDITVCVRDGLIEVDSQVNFSVSQSTASVTIKPNYNEKPRLTGPLKWYFRDGSTATNDSTVIHTLFSVDENFKRCVLANDIKPTGGLKRSIAQAITESSNLCSLAADADTVTELTNSSNLDYARIHVTQSWTSSLYFGLSLSGSNIQYTKPAAQSDFYYNGFDRGVNQGFAPYFIEGLSAHKTDDTWYADDNFIYLPNHGFNYVSALPLDTPVLVSADRYTINLDCSFHTPTFSTLEENYTGSPQVGGSFVLATGDDFSFKGSINFLEGSGIHGNGNNCDIEITSSYWIGNTPAYIGLDTAPETVTGALIHDSKDFQYWGTNNAGGKAAHIHAVGGIKDCLAKNGPTQAFASNASTAASITIETYRNVAYNLGMPNGFREERFCINDGGGFYHNGVSVTCDHKINAAVVFNVCGFKGVYGYYIDNNGIDGTYSNILYFNIFGGQGFYNRNASGLTDGNTYSKIVGKGPFVAGDISSASLSDSAIMGVKNLGGGVVESGYMPAYIEHEVYDDYIALFDIITLNENGVSALTNPIISPFVQELGDSTDYFGSFAPVAKGSTTDGAGTYTVQKGRFRKIGNKIEFVMTIRYSAHTGTGNLQVDLSDIGFSAATSSGELYPVTVWANTSSYSGYLTSGGSVVEIDPAVTIPSGSAVITISGFYPT